MRPGIITPQLEILDRVPSDMAFSCQRISRAYTGPWAIIRRESDGDILGVPFKGLLPDVSALLDFTGTGVSAAGRMVTWPDQGPNGWDAEQLTESAQPLVVDGGVRVVDANGQQSILFDGSNHYLNVADLDARNLFRNLPRAAVMAVATNKNNSEYVGNIFDVNAVSSSVSIANLRLVSGAQGRTASTARQGDASFYHVIISANGQMDNSGVDFIYQHSGYYAWQTVEEELGINGGIASRVNNGLYRNVANFDTNAPSPDETPSGINIGSRAGIAHFYNGLISEVIVATGISHESEIEVIERSQMSRWDI